MAGNGTRLYTVDKFLGINEGADGFTEVNMGEASAMKNFLITDACNLTLRPGIQRLDPARNRTPGQILALWSGQIGRSGDLPEGEYLVMADLLEGEDRVFLYRYEEGSGWTAVLQSAGCLGLTEAEGAVVKIFAFSSRLYIMSTGKTCVLENGTLQETQAYIPKVIAGMDPAGGGTTLENINLLTGKRRVDFSADGEATAFHLPSEAVQVLQIQVDNTIYPVEELGSFDAGTAVFTFATAPVKGVGNVEFIYDTDPETAESCRQQILSQPLAEAYNGSTDTRLFVGGCGNICYYSGITETAEANPLYFPAMNEVKVDVTGAAVTGLVRHYTKLLAYTAEGAYTISYEPVTQTDGSTIAGFYLRTMNREFGNEALGQVQTVNNYPRTITKDAIYEWRITSSYYKDERYAKRISDKVKRTLQNADPKKIVTCDDNYSKTYYVFLNDESGSVLVNRYDMGKEEIWCIYESRLSTGVTHAVMMGGTMVFGNGQELFYFSNAASKDAPADPEGEPEAIAARWESGFMDFGADFRRKYSNVIYVSMLPQTNSALTITAETDKRSEYMEKGIRSNLFSFSNLGFSRLTFNTSATPRIQRVRLKVKKFVYYKLIFKVEQPGALATILGYDQTVRFGPMAK